MEDERARQRRRVFDDGRECGRRCSNRTVQQQLLAANALGEIMSYFTADYFFIARVCREWQQAYLNAQTRDQTEGCLTAARSTAASRAVASLSRVKEAAQDSKLTRLTLCCAAGEYGSVETATFLLDSNEDGSNECTQGLAAGAAQGERLDILQYMVQERGFHLDFHQLASLAIEQSLPRLLSWAVRQDATALDLSEATSSIVFARAMLGGSRPILDFLQQESAMQWDEDAWLDVRDCIFDISIHADDGGIPPPSLEWVSDKLRFDASAPEHIMHDLIVSGSTKSLTHPAWEPKYLQHAEQAPDSWLATAMDLGTGKTFNWLMEHGIGGAWRPESATVKAIITTIEQRCLEREQLDCILRCQPHLHDVLVPRFQCMQQH